MACENHSEMNNKHAEASRQIQILAERVTKLETESARYDEKIDRIFADIDSIKDILESIQKQLKYISEKPARKWDGLSDKIMFLIVGGIVTYILTQLLP